IEQSIDKKIITGKKAEQLQTFVKIFKKITFDDKPTVCINHIIFETNYYTYLKDNFDQKEAEIKIENIKELLRAAQFFEEQNATHNTLLFLHEIALMQEKINKQHDSDEKVYLMTLHG